MRLMAHFPVVVISGARQVGKSTLLRHLFPEERNYIVFDPYVDVENARHDPELFLANHPGRPLILDEIQFAPQLVASIKRMVDAGGTNGQFVLTGSQQWQVMKHLAESLAGRVAFIDLEGFTVEERFGGGTANWLESWLASPEEFVRAQAASPPCDSGSLFESIFRGSLPKATLLESDLLPGYFDAYIRTYLDRDARMLGDVSDWQQFGRFLRLAGALTAQEINHSQFGRDIGISPQTAQRWLNVLRGTLQWHDVPAFSGNTVKRVSQRPKGYFSDTGIACHAQYITSPAALSVHPLLGALFETLVVGELRKLNALMNTKASMYHWRTTGGAEVDILLERDDRLFPMEIKAGSRPSRRDVRGITALRQTYPQRDIAPGLVLAPVNRIFRVSENDWAIPWNLCLKK